MLKIFLRFCFLLCILSSCFRGQLQAQESDRIQQIHQRLDSLSKTVPGLNQQVQLLMSGVGVRDYLNALARINNLSISTDPNLNFTIFENFNGVTATNILVLLAQKYNLDITSVGSIINVIPFKDPSLLLKPVPKEPDVTYSAKSNLLSMSLSHDTLAAAARKITQVSDKNIIVPATLQNKLVSAYISNAPFDAAMEKLAYANEIKMVKTNDNFYVFQPLGENEEVYVNGDRSTSVRKNFPALSPQVPGGTNGIFTRKVNGKTLISADASNTPIINMVRQVSQETGNSYSIYSDIKGNITLHVTDVPYDTFLSLLFKSTPYTFHSEDNIYLIGDRKLEGLRTVKAIHLQNRSIDTVMTMIPNDWKNSIEIKEFREQNTLLISGSAAQIKEAEDFIKQIDVLVPTVVIEVTMIDIRKSKSISTGISAGISDSVKTGGTVLSGLNYTFGAKSINNFLNSLSGHTSINLGRVTPNFYLSIKALEESNNVEVRSVPKLVTLNGHTANMSIGNKLYYRNSTQNVIPVSSSTQSIFTNTYTAVDANLSIFIKPIVSGDDQVTLGITVNISSFTAIPTDGSPPPQAISKFETNLRVHSEDTIVLGGIERTENDESGSGIPLLSRIPVLKWLFSSRTKSNAKVVSVLFIKPTILR